MWQKADDMEHEIKVKADDRWMDDSEVSHCLGCKSEFSFLLRKVCVVNSHFVFSQKTNGRVVIMLASRDSSSGLAELLALSLLASEGHPRLDPYIEKQILRFSTKYTVV